VCEIEGVFEMKAYLEYVRVESKRCFGQGLTSLEASQRIDVGPYANWRSPAHLYLNVERAYREFRSEPVNAPWDAPRSFDSIYEVAKARRIKVEF
jgi:cyclase